MIGRLTGCILRKQPPWLLIDVNGVGYEVEAPMSTFYVLPDINATVVLHTHLLVREDAQILYGFASDSDRSLFRALLKISGVGGKMALAILSGMTASEFALAVQAGDVAQLTRIPGVGKKTAERLIIEMRDRLDKLELGDAAVAAAKPGETPGTSEGDAVSALIALGYKPNDASKMIRTASEPGMNTEAMIKAALQAKLK